MKRIELPTKDYDSISRHTINQILVKLGQTDWYVWYLAGENGWELTNWDITKIAYENSDLSIEDIDIEEFDRQLNS